MAQEAIIVEQPRVHLVHMVVFTLLVVIIAAVLFPNIKNAFMANPGLNGLIVGTLIFGALYAFRMVWRLFPEVNWLNGFKLGQGSMEARPPCLLPCQPCWAMLRAARFCQRKRCVRCWILWHPASMNRATCCATLWDC